MKEREVRQRIESFLKRTARELVVPASVGVGLALSGCDHTAIRVSRDAAADTAARPDGIVADATLGRESIVNSPDAASPPDLRLPDDTRSVPDIRQADLPIVMPPYLAFIPPDAGTDVGLDARVDAGRPDAGMDVRAPDASADSGVPDAGALDAGAEVRTPDAGADARIPDARPDTRQADLPIIVPPYTVPPLPDAAQDLPTVMPPYMLPAYLPAPFDPPQLPPDPPPAPPPPPPPTPPPPTPVYMGASFTPVAPPAPVPPAKAPK